MIKKGILLLGLICFLGYFAAAKVFQKDTDNLTSKTNGEVVTIKTGFSFTEGPAVDKYGNVFFTDQPNDIIYVDKRARYAQRTLDELMPYIALLNTFFLLYLAFETL